MLNTFIVNVSASVFCEKLLIKSVINLRWIFFKLNSNNFDFCLNKSVLLLNWIVFTKHCNKLMIMLRKKLSVSCKNCLIKKKLSITLFLKLCLSYLMWCQLIFNNLFLYFLFKTSKCSHTVLKILSEFSDVFWDIIIFLFYEIVNFFTNHFLF